MSLRFAYRRFSARHPVLTLSGRSDRPRPVIPITIIGPADARLLVGLLDTGADDSLFPEHLAATIGIDLSGAPTSRGSGVGMNPVPFRVARVTLRIADSNEQREWMSWVGFTPAALRQPILGFAGFLQFFSTTFHGDREEVELTANQIYPGS